MSAPRFQTARGRLTAYALSCGDVETVKTADRDTVLTLWREHCTYHVREHSFTHGRRFWYSYHTLTAARARFDVAKAVLRKVHGIAPRA